MSKLTLNFPDGDEMVLINPGKIFADWPADFDGDCVVDLHYEDGEETGENDEK